MTNKQFLEIEKKLLPQLPFFHIKGPLMLLPPVTYLLRGIHFDRRSAAEWFYVQAFVIPLCVPTRYLWLNFGEQVRNARGGNGWLASTPSLIDDLAERIKADAIPFLSRVDSLLDFAELAMTGYATDPNYIRAAAFSLARAGHIDQSITFLDQRMPLVHPAYAWQTEVLEMCNGLREKLMTDPEAAQAQLAAWEAETVHNLKLEEFWQPTA